MQEVIVYDRIEDKNKIEKELFKPLSGPEALIQTLNLMDFLAALSKAKRENENIEWIELMWNDYK